MIKSDLQRVYIYSIYPRGSKIHSDRGFVKLGKGQMRVTHWCVFYVKGNESFYFDSFGGQLDKFQLKQSPRPIIHHSYKNQDINSKFCGSFCLYFFKLKE